MVKFATSIVYGSALVAGVLAAPRPDSAIGDEVAVSAPNGTPITDTAELASQTAAEASASLASEMAASSAMYTSVASDSSSYNTMGSGSYSMDSSDNSWMSDSSNNYMSDSIDTSYMTDTMDSSYMTNTMDSSYEYTSESWDSSTSVYLSTSTISTYESTSTISYGSGSSSWNMNSYDDCVQQCVASFGSPMATYTPPSSSYGNGGDSSNMNSGSGTTHTIIVAPMQGVLRYVPFATNASVGDTIEFMWGANMHTVTHSSEFSPCNKTDEDPFTSGVQNKSFTFQQVVNSTDPLFFYCGVPTHCQKGMFGIINPPSALTADTSINSMMPSMVMNSSDIAAMAAYQQNMTSKNAMAANWGSAINMANIPSDNMASVAENVMYTRTFLAANPELFNADGSVDMSKASGPFQVPQDISAALKDASTSSTASDSSSTSSGSGTSAAASTTPTKSAAGKGVVASSAFAGVVALAAALFAL